MVEQSIKPDQLSPILKNMALVTINLNEVTKKWGVARSEDRYNWYIKTEKRHIQALRWDGKNWFVANQCPLNDTVCHYTEIDHHNMKRVIL